MQPERDGQGRPLPVEYFPDDPIVERATRRLLDELRPHVLHVEDSAIVVTPRGFSLLPEYSCSYPTGVADGKVWRVDRWFGANERQRAEAKAYDPREERRWLLREYVDRGDPRKMGLHDRYLTVRQ